MRKNTSYGLFFGASDDISDAAVPQGTTVGISAGGSPLICVSSRNHRFRMRDERKHNEADPLGGIIESGAPWWMMICLATRILTRG